MSLPNPAPRRDPVPIHGQAIDNLRYIRETMERAGSFTAISGWGMIAMGVIALVAAALATRAQGVAWLAIWLGAALVALAIGLGTADRKARAAGVPLFNGPGRSFVYCFSVPALVAMLTTIAVIVGAASVKLPALWLLLYGTGIASAGAFSVRSVPALGLGFVALGGVALFAPASWGNALLALGFGGLHMVFGYRIARKHGG
jgi:hypothetical protein